jgi:CMP-N-acetylneuraminic acid synthetase/spore coat polysaccharide biosynthesis predicted glycosyltransferase SpsG
MNHTEDILVVIPARGGSKGIPRKNLRPLAGRPLLSYSIATALSSGYVTDVCVSSEDEEILQFAGHFGATPVRRPAGLAEDATTLDPVIYQAWREMEKLTGKTYSIVATMQPTSPLLRTQSLDMAIEGMLANDSIDTVLSAKEDAHLSWRREDGRYLPNYEKRLNRQQLKPEFRETGGFVLTRVRAMRENSRFGPNVSLQILRGAETIDIDDYTDWNLCEYYMSRRRVLFVVSGYKEIGLGHVYNCVLLAHEIMRHEVLFLVDSRSGLALEKIRSYNYPVQIQESADIIEDISRIGPDFVINDRLDTDADYVKRLKSLGAGVANFEDLGEGAQYADLVVNAIYPERLPREGHYYGGRYFALRDEFIMAPAKRIEPLVKEVLLTFGGVDPCNNTKKVLDAIHGECTTRRITITVIAGFGYDKYETIASYNDIKVLRDVTDIATHMGRADLVFTSAGRTTYEIAAIGTPAIVIAQNQRETTHFFASSEYGFLNLGLSETVGAEDIRGAFLRLVESQALRRQMHEAMKAVDLRGAKKNVIKLLLDAIEEK